MKNKTNPDEENEEVLFQIFNDGNYNELKKLQKKNEP